MVTRTLETLLEQGRPAQREHRIKYARNLFKKALKESRDSGEDGLRAVLYEELAYVDRNLLYLDAACEHYIQSSEIYRALGNPLKVAHTARHAADVLREQKKLDESENLYGEALEIYRNHAGTSPLDLANAIRGFALLKEDRGHREDAFRLWAEAGKLYEQTGVDAGVEESKRRIHLLNGE